jgi:cation transport protein ChaC
MSDTSTPDGGDLWVFGYGSLMWQPGFAFVESGHASLTGWRRSFCLRSILYRGTPEAPGLVLGLDADPDATCHGVAFRVAQADAGAVRTYLRARELVTYAYAEVEQPVALWSGKTVTATTFVIDRSHPQYAGRLAPAEQAAIIARARGSNGTNRAYLDSTLSHLAQASIADPALEHIGRLVGALD